MKKQRMKWISLLLILLVLISGCSPKDDIRLEDSSELLVEEITEEETNPAAFMEEDLPTDSPQEEIEEILPEEEPENLSKEENRDRERTLSVREDGEYTSKEEVALYIRQFGKLPENFITKKEAEALGWNAKKGNLDEVAKGKSIGGDFFGNREKKLPSASGRKWRECDIDFEGGFRNAKRIVFSNDGLIYYTGDHYETFEQLY
ncbi:MAG: ribonuclease domain-containing protein [Peptostreptococcaceae bacterium]|nr:ribonuclease domain-containing protein [Peptostreptococcaceae bacterium]